jgi:hypothetical protein
MVKQSPPTPNPQKQILDEFLVNKELFFPYFQGVSKPQLKHCGINYSEEVHKPHLKKYAILTGA